MTYNLTTYNLINGNKEALNQLFDLYLTNLYTFAKFYLQDDILVEDVVQDAYIQLWEKRKTLHKNQDCFVVLKRLVKNKCIDILRHQKVKDKYLQEALLYNIEHDELKDNKEFILKVNSLINQLPQKTKTVLKMSAFQEKKYKEIAEELSMSLDNVKFHMKKAYKYLKENIKPDKNSFILFWYRLKKCKAFYASK